MSPVVVVLCGSLEGVLKPGLGDGGINGAVLIELRLLVEEVADTGGENRPFINKGTFH